MTNSLYIYRVTKSIIKLAIFSDMLLNFVAVVVVANWFTGHRHVLKDHMTGSGHTSKWIHP